MAENRNGPEALEKAFNKVFPRELGDYRHKSNGFESAQSKLAKTYYSAKKGAGGKGLKAGQKPDVSGREMWGKLSNKAAEKINQAYKKGSIPLDEAKKRYDNLTSELNRLEKSLKSATPQIKQVASGTSFMLPKGTKDNFLISDLLKTAVPKGVETLPKDLLRRTKELPWTKFNKFVRDAFHPTSAQTLETYLTKISEGAGYKKAWPWLGYGTHKAEKALPALETIRKNVGKEDSIFQARSKEALDRAFKSVTELKRKTSPPKIGPREVKSPKIDAAMKALNSR